MSAVQRRVQQGKNMKVSCFTQWISFSMLSIFLSVYLESGAKAP